MTRFIDTLAYRGYLTRKSEGKASYVYVTRDGRRLRNDIAAAWKDLHVRYSKTLGLKAGNELTFLIDKATQKLSDIG